MPKYYRGVAMILLSAFGFALMPTFAKFAYQYNITVETLLLIRFSLAAIVFFSYLFITKQNIRLDKRDLFWLFSLGAICYTTQSVFFFSAVKSVPASLVILIIYTHPTIIAIASCLIDHEPITKNMAISLISSFVGLALMLGTAFKNINLTGVLLAALAALIYSLYVILSNRILKKIPPLIASAFIALFTSFGLVLFGSFAGNLSFQFQRAAWPGLLGLVIFSTVLAMITFFNGLKILGPTKATVLSMAEPVFGVTIAIILFHDQLTPLQFLGATGIIAGAITSVYALDQEPQPETTVINIEDGRINQ